ncbi:MAG: AhpC/TSA family protein [Muribaculaceae bacterium]|nr:AhpC/TSA family protein [Muribaculaceae bacterium]
MNKITRYFVSMASIAAIAMAGGCGEKGFKIEGQLSDSDNDKVLLEKADYSGYWTIVDSTRTDSKGNFKFTQPQQSGPEIFRLTLDDKYIYLPVDSTETLTVTSSKGNFGHDFTVTGTEQATRMAQFEKDLIAFIPYIDNADSMKNFKKRIYNEYMHDGRGNVMTYYILTKTIGNRALFDLTTDDYRYIVAVANNYQQFRPDDAHAPFLLNLARAAQRHHNDQNGIHTIINAEEIKVIDIALNDENGKEQKLSDMVGKGKPVVVAFTLMRDGASPEINRQLAELYKAGRIDIYNVSPDRDQYGWREAAGNLPWTTVLDPSAGQDKVFIQYNVGQLPTFFIYNANGELTARCMSVKEIREKL